MPDGGPGREEIEHIDAIFTALKYLYGFCISDYTPFLQGLDLDGQEKFVLDANNHKELSNPIIDERIQQWRSSERKEMEDLLDVFVTLQDSDGKPLLTPDEIKNQIAEIMILPVDNPLNAIEWAMGEMLNQPEILAKTIEELDRVVGKDRLVWAILSPNGLGRNPKTRPDPLKYDAERHLIEGVVVLTEHDFKVRNFQHRKAWMCSSFAWKCHDYDVASQNASVLYLDSSSECYQDCSH
ncbi:hypothetical protein GH714_017965 [Hevea brasiliensis]|uniref:Uncharacterized protein n=1 Tax=Hevea brasiliensis TaxID=3981 RepID=A0A6A6K5I8_HEVBR|nr:hypothetical protein GH714_017965 [Hevea brasiliensis]